MNVSFLFLSLSFGRLLGGLLLDRFYFFCVVPVLEIYLCFL